MLHVVDILQVACLHLSCDSKVVQQGQDAIFLDLFHSETTRILLRDTAAIIGKLQTIR